MDWHAYRSMPAWEEGGADEGVGDSGAIAVTSGASDGGQGAWVEIIASTARDAEGILVHLGPRGATTGFGSTVEIGIGGAGSEQSLIDALILDTIADADKVESFYLPFFIPKGSRLAARASDGSTSAIAVDVSIGLCSGARFPSAPFGSAESWGWSNRGFGTGADPGATANTKGAWIELTSAMNRTIYGAVFYLSGNTSAATTANWLLDIGVGGAGSEKIKLPNLRASISTAKDIVTPGVIGPLPLHIPQGSRVAHRAQCSITDATDRILRVVMTGLT